MDMRTLHNNNFCNVHTHSVLVYDSSFDTYEATEAGLTGAPTAVPMRLPSGTPMATPTRLPSASPTAAPSEQPSTSPTIAPSVALTTVSPAGMLD